MANDQAAVDAALLTHTNYADKSNYKVKNIIFWLLNIIAIVAVVCCGYIIKTRGIFPITQQQQTAQTADEREMQAVKLPDNIEIVLQDIIDQLQTQKNTIRDLESLVASDLKPQVYFLLKEYAANQQPYSNKAQTVDLSGQADTYLQGLLSKIFSEADLAMRGLHDVKQAKILLEFAEQILSANSEEKYSRLKAALVADKQALASVQQVDKTQLWTKLAALLAQVHAYEYKKSVPMVPATVAVAADPGLAVIDNSSQTINWRQALAKTWAQFKALIKIKRSNNAAAAVATFATLTEDSQRQRLGLTLEQARIASMQGEEKIYAASLGSAKELLLTYFVAENVLTQQASSELDFLLGVKLQPQLPTLQSLAEFSAITQLVQESLPE